MALLLKRANGIIVVDIRITGVCHEGNQNNGIFIQLHNTDAAVLQLECDGTRTGNTKVLKYGKNTTVKQAKDAILKYTEDKIEDFSTEDISIGELRVIGPNNVIVRPRDEEKIPLDAKEIQYTFTMKGTFKAEDYTQIKIREDKNPPVWPIVTWGCLGALMVFVGSSMDPVKPLLSGKYAQIEALSGCVAAVLGGRALEKSHPHASKSSYGVAVMIALAVAGTRLPENLLSYNTKATIVGVAFVCQVIPAYMHLKGDGGHSREA